jgi:Arc/MetJ-type ribon-helix-helix transcriptional regulator
VWNAAQRPRSSCGWLPQAVSVSLPDDDVEHLDAYARDRGLESRSAAVHKAVRLRRASELASSYEAA